ncbi:ABC transporter substrate-binding protein [Microbacterium radiodurans]|uniref:Extracellular solute-binding protein n=1 Tax=Microbacterium radiodurans TaxID=661398 RepID=A0A5J5INN4_9MICO|nr:extracellular solute-binding protein [Microbacterium radiodurans]KAA9083755.1 extracellular solute-binding protein [Microbacterium radiodurans]
MKRSTRAATAALALALPASLVLAACSGGGGGDQAAGDDNTLTVWTWDPAFNIYAMEEAEKIYQQDNPEFELEIVEVPWEDLQTRLTTIAQSQAWGELPDIFLMQNNAFQKNGINYPDLFSDLGDAGIDFSEFPDSVVAYSTLDGMNYGVPFDSGTAVTALRTDVLEQAGYSMDDFTDITWDTFIEQGKDVLAQTGMPLLSGIAGQSDLIVMMLQSSGASLFDDDGMPTIVDNDSLNAAIDVYAEMVDAGVYLEVNSWDEYVGSFVNGNVAGTQQGVWIVGSIQSAEDQAGLWGITNVPSLDGVTGATNYTANGGSSWAISSNANTELAADFLAATFAGSTELYDTILPGAGAVANWIPAGDSDVYAEPSEFFGGEPIFSEVVEYGSEVPSNNTGAYYYEGRDAVSAAITQIMNGADRDTALAEAQANVEFAMQ